MKSASVIKAKFLRSGIRSDSTILWEDLSIDSRKLILSKTNLPENEKVILGFVPNFDDWWLLTEKQIVIFEKRVSKYIQLNEINSIEPKEIFELKKSKLENVSLVLYTARDKIALIVEERTWHAIYSILKFVIHT